MTDEAMRMAAKALFDVAPFGESEGPLEGQSEEYRRWCLVYARAAVVAFLQKRAEKVTGDRALYLRSEAERLETGRDG